MFYFQGPKRKPGIFYIPKGCPLWSHPLSHSFGHYLPSFEMVFCFRKRNKNISNILWHDNDDDDGGIQKSKRDIFQFNQNKILQLLFEDDCLSPSVPFLSVTRVVSHGWVAFTVTRLGD